ncbi:CWC16 protein [Ganoderma leucocontextum]|nr:CWC16 protein [Ganoderma leucocontextum]
MQGFNKYYPPDYDPEKHSSLNAYRGKHALGDRARKIGEGILIVRFELPFNIWCGTCNNHIGMGVRYNAEKKKIGNYYSTPIYSFRCKCHLCSGWFEIQTDPKNTRYVVVSGARQKDEEWDPEENGGFAVHETDPNQGPVDPLAALEKSTDAQNHMNNVQVPRVEALQSLADHYGSDPYSHSLRVRKRFREQKKLDKAREDADEAIKSSYGLPEALALSKEDDKSILKAKEEWEQGRQAFEARESSKRRRLGAEVVSVMPRISSSHAFSGNGQSSHHASGSGIKTTNTSDPVSSLRAKILGNTARQGLGRPKPPDSKSARGLVKRI